MAKALLCMTEKTPLAEGRLMRGATKFISLQGDRGRYLKM